MMPYFFLQSDDYITLKVEHTRALTSPWRCPELPSPPPPPLAHLTQLPHLILQERTSAHILAGKPGPPEGVATIDIAVEALKCAEYLTPLLTEALQAKV